MDVSFEDFVVVDAQWLGREMGNFRKRRGGRWGRIARARATLRAGAAGTAAASLAFAFPAFPGHCTGRVRGFGGRTRGRVVKSAGGM